MDVESIAAFGKSSGVYAFMNTAYGWPFIESLHYLGLATLLGTVGLFDLRMLGLGKGIPMASLHRYVPFGVAAYLCNIATGSLFFMSAPDQYAYNPSFQLKIACMAIAGVNVVVFYLTLAKAVKATPPDEAAPWPAKIVAAISLGSWLGVIIFGRLITYFRPPYHWCFWCD
ncbi:hypothetical protein BH11PSE2_BH11PSE2_16600 [soil metagenome]